jgi:hypothetical protein
VIVCRNCGHENESGAAFCGNCGKFLEWTGEQPPEPPAPGPAAPERAAPTPAAPVPGPAAPEPTPTPAAPTPAAPTPEPGPPAPGPGPAATGVAAADEVSCPACGTSHPPSRAVCKSCATPLKGAGQPIVAAPGPVEVTAQRSPPWGIIAIVAVVVVAVVGIGATFGLGIIGGDAATPTPTATAPPTEPPPTATPRPTATPIPPPDHGGDIVLSTDPTEEVLDDLDITPAGTLDPRPLVVQPHTPA